MIPLFRKLKIRLHGRADFAAIRARLGMRLTLFDKAVLLISSIDEWREARFVLATAELAAKRRAVCESHECWKRTPFPHCSVCGCSAAKFRLGSAHCPCGHW